MSDFAYFVFSIVCFIVAFMFLKKIAGCLIKTVIFIVIAVVLAAIYFYMNEGTCPVTL